MNRLRHVFASLLACVALIACGGGEPARTDGSADAAGRDGAVQRHAPSDSIPTPPTGVSWVSCSTEWFACTLPSSGAQTVLYGRDTATPGWSVNQAFNGVSSVACSNAVFGDPTPGFGKRCYYAVADGGTAVAPVITTQPVSTSVLAGRSAAFTMTFTGGGVVEIQWQVRAQASSDPEAGWANVSNNGAAQSYVTWPTAGGDNGSQYRVVVTTSAGVAKSPAVTLTVTGGAVPPAIAAQPAPVTVALGSDATFSVQATGTAPLDYTWLRNGTAIAGANASTYVLTTTSADNGALFSVRVVNAAGIVTSNTALLTVTGVAQVAPTIASAPVSASVQAGASASFSVVAQGTAPLAYQWFRNGVAIGGATSSQVQVATTAADADTTAQITVRVSNSVGTVTSAAAVLTVTPAAAVTWILCTQEWQVCQLPANGTYTILYGRDTTTPDWSVTKSFTNVSSVACTNAVFGDPTPGFGKSCWYGVSGGVTVAPTITSQPSAISVQAGSTASFGVVAQGTAPLTYQWFRNGAAIASATTAQLQLTTLAADAGTTAQITVQVSNAAGSVTSASARLTVTPVVTGVTYVPCAQEWQVCQLPAVGSYTIVYGRDTTTSGWSVTKSFTGVASVSCTNTEFGDPTPGFVKSCWYATGGATAVAPTIATQPASTSVQAGATATFSVAAQGTAPLTYQWLRNGVAISGATAAQLQVVTTAAEAGTTAQITVRVTNSAGDVTSAAATLTIAAPIVAPTIATQPASTSVQAGATATFGVAAQGTAPLTYQWLRNGVAISGATAAQLQIVTTAAEAGTTAQITVRVTNSAGNATSAAATLTITAVASPAVRFVAPTGAASSLASVSTDGLTVSFAGTGAVGVKSNVALAANSGLRYFEATRVGNSSVGLGVSASAPSVPNLAGGAWVAARDSAIVDDWLVIATDVFGTPINSASAGIATYGVAVDFRQKYPVAYVIGRSGDNPSACEGLAAADPCVYRRVQLSDTNGSIAIYAFNKGDGVPGTSVSINAGADLVGKPYVYSMPGVHHALRVARLEGSTGLNMSWPPLSGDPVGPTLSTTSYARAVIRQGDTSPVRNGFTVATAAVAAGSVVRWTDDTAAGASLGTGPTLSLTPATVAQMTVGDHRIVASVIDAVNGRYTERTFTLTIIASTSNGDDDGDGLTYDQEKLLGTDPANPDTDGDGLADGAEAALGMNPTLADTNGNGVIDGFEFANTAQQPRVGGFVAETGITSSGVIITAEGQRAAFSDDVNPDCARNLPPFADPVYTIEICRKRGVRANAGVRAGEFRYFETKRLFAPENMGHGVTTRAAQIDPFCCAADGALHPLTPPSLQFNSVIGQALIRLVNQPQSMLRGGDRDQSVTYGFVVDYRSATNPDIYMVLTDAAGQMVVSEKFALTGFDGGDVMPYAYGHPLSDVDPHVEINLGLRTFHYAPSAIAAALSAQGVSTQGFAPGVGLHRWAVTAAPTIVTGPGSLTVVAGTTAVFNVAAQGDALTYQWFRNGTAVVGATAARLQVATTAADANTTAQFTVRVGNGAGQVTSAAATLTVTAPLLAPSIVTQPTSASVTAGSTASFGVVAQGSGPLAYQWYRDGAPIAGANAAQVSIATVATEAGTTARIEVLVSNSVGGLMSTPAVLTVTAAQVAPTIATPPGPLTVTAGTTAVFNVTAQGTGPLAYQWSRNGAAIAGATSAQLQVATTPAEAGTTASFTVRVSNSFGSVTSNAAVLTITAPALAPTITTAPVSVSVVPGATAGFNVVAQGAGPLSYQWFRNGAVIAGATSAQLQVTTTSADAGTKAQITVQVGNGAGSLVSTPATLTVTINKTYLYVADITTQDIAAFEVVDPAAGHLVELAGPRASTQGKEPRKVIADRAGRFLYVTDRDTSSIAVLAIDARTGSLTPIAGSPFTLPSVDYPFGLAMHPDGRTAIVTSVTGDSVSMLRLDPTTGVPSLLAGPFPAGSAPGEVLLNKAGTLAFVANQFSGSVSVYAVDAANASMTPVAGSPFVTGGDWVYQLALHPTEDRLYAVNYDSGTVTGFRIGAGGVLTQVAGTPVNAGPQAYGVFVDGSGSRLYVAVGGAGAIAGYDIAANGALTPLAAGTFDSGGTHGLVLDPSGRMAVVAHFGLDTISTLTPRPDGTWAVRETFAVGAQPLAMGFVTFP